MKIFVKVLPKSKQQKIQKLPDGSFKVWVKAVPEKGKANEELRQVLSSYFKVARTRVNIVVGHKSKGKIVEIRE